MNTCARVALMLDLHRVYTLAEKAVPNFAQMGNGELRAMRYDLGLSTRLHSNRNRNRQRAERRRLDLRKKLQRRRA